MNKLLCIGILACLSLAACKKVIDRKKEEILIDAITSSKWYIYSYQEGTTDITASFSPYTFQFHRNGTVSGFTGTTEELGTWEGDIDTKSITTNFPGAEEPINKLNAVWKITNNTWDYVKAETTIDGQKNLLHLKKK
ncbi:MAG TPA: hypothetical protein VIK80_04505 [Flavihumibacter sp.]|jgi:hypothetical protein